MMFESTVDTKTLKYTIPYSSSFLKDFVLIVLPCTFLVPIFEAFDLFFNRKELKFFILRPVSFLDIVISKLINSFKESAKIVLLLTLPSLSVYYIQVVRVLKKLTRLKNFIFLNVCYVILAPLYFAFIVLISTFIVFVIAILVETLLRKLRANITIKLPKNQLLILFLMLLFVLTFSTTLFSLTNARNTTIYGPFPIYYITKAIISITRPVPNFHYSFLFLLALLGISTLTFIVLILVVNITSDIILTLPEFGESKENINSLKQGKMKGVHILNNLPYLIKHDLLIFLRRGESFRLFMSQLASQIVLFILFILAPSISIESANPLHSTIFGVTYHYLVYDLIFLLIATLSLGFAFQLKSEGKCIFLIKISLVDSKDFVFMKFLSAIIIEFGIFLPLLTVFFLFFTSSKYPYYQISAFLQYLILYFWFSILNFYHGAENYDLDVIYGNMEVGRSSLLQAIQFLIIFGIWSLIFKLIYSSKPIFGFAMIASELLLALIILKKIVDFASYKIENLSLEKE